MKYFIYARKSTEEEDRQILSIEAQLVELKEFAAKEKLEIVASFQEAKTAKEPGRIIFGEMLARIEKGEASGIISWHPDRLARNSVDGGKIIHMIDKGAIKALKFPTFWFEPTPQGLFMLSIAFGQSKYYIDNLRENVKRGMRQKIRNGVWPSLAPIGYLNNPKTRGIDVDPIKGPLIRQIFDLYATEDYSLGDLERFCEEHHLTGFHGKRVRTSYFFTLLQNIFYTGLMKYDGEVFEGTHEPLISKKLFEEVKNVMRQRGKKRGRIKKHDFPFVGLLKCSCGCSITAETQKGHNYYRCTKKKQNCLEKHFLREEELENQIKNYLQKVSISTQETEKILFEIDKEEKQAKGEAIITVQNLKSELENINQRLEKLLDVYLSETITTEEYTSRKQKILTRKLELNEKIQDFEQNGVSWVEPAREFILSLNQANILMQSPEKKELAAFLKNIGSNRILQNRQLLLDFKIPYDLVAQGGQNNQQNLTFPNWWTLQDSNL
ncbi:MAG: recombinase family protein [Patescibacteria group bacterium]